MPPSFVNLIPNLVHSCTCDLLPLRAFPVLHSRIKLTAFFEMGQRRACLIVPQQFCTKDQPNLTYQLLIGEWACITVK